MRKQNKTEKEIRINYCKLAEQKDRQFASGVNSGRQKLILVSDKKWNNGTVLHYHFFDEESDGEEVLLSKGTKKFITYKGGTSEKKIVRKAFKVWKDIGLGLDFVEVKDRFDSELRIGFMKGDGSWSYLGRNALNFGFNERTINFGWNISRDLDTALHEIGHALGFPHAHQNPNAGIVWNEEAVYKELAKPPNNWSRKVTERHILRKIPTDLVQGSNWDPDSIMHYPFSPGMIERPKEYGINGLFPAPGLSPRDIQWARSFYPQISNNDLTTLEPAKSMPLNLGFGHQQSFFLNLVLLVNIGYLRMVRWTEYWSCLKKIHKENGFICLGMTIVVLRQQQV